MSSGSIIMDCKDPETGVIMEREVDWEHCPGGQPGMDSFGTKIGVGGVIVCKSDGKVLEIPVDKDLEDIIYPTGERSKPSYDDDFKDALEERITANKHLAS